MASLILQLLAAVLLASGGWFFFRPRPIFEIRVKDGVARRTRGHVGGAFLRDVQDACEGLGVTHGLVRGKPRGDRIGVEFAGPIPAACQQRIRNLWANSRDSERRLG